MHRLLILPLAAFLLSACGPKTGSTTEVAAEAAPVEVKPEIPADKNSEKFANTLLSLSIDWFSPIDSTSGAKFSYTSLDFSSDNSWNAAGYVEVQDERMECKEAGTWSMEPAESATVATMTWTLSSTDCINQEVGQARRYKVTLEGDRLSVEYR